MGKTLDTRDHECISKRRVYLLESPQKIANFAHLLNPNQITKSNMKWMIFAVAFLAVAHAEELSADEGEARLGYITVGNSGATTLTFNATSIQNAVILGLFILVLGALVLPLFGVAVGDSTGDSGSGYGYGYDNSGYSTYSKRSVEAFGPVLDALNAAQ